MFLARKKNKLKKTNSPTGSFHPTSFHHHYLQQYQAWFYVPIFFLIYSRLIRQIFGEFTCNDNKSILEFSILRRRIMKRIIMLLGLHLCNGIWFAFMQSNMIFHFRTVHLVFLDVVIVVVVILMFIIYVVFVLHFTSSITYIFIQNIMNTPPKIWHRQIKYLH